MSQPTSNAPTGPAPDAPAERATPTTRAIDALRAATDAAGSKPPQPSPDEVSQIGRLHDATETAERRARRAFATPGARRKLQYAIAAENAALQLHGFNSYEAFAAHYEPQPNEAESDETIARIRVLLTELGVDPQDDPVQAASAFLTTHEGAIETEAAYETTSAEHEPFEETPERIVEHFEIATAVAGATPAPDFSAAPAEPPIAPSPVPDEIGLEETADEMWAQPPPPKEPAVAPEDEVVDRWIHAEARAERMHAEVDRAQAELMAMLARSADLEESVVTRDDELDAANAELERVRQRVEELEGSIARSDAGRDELERALAASRARVNELETALLERERASAQATNDHALTMQAVAELELTGEQRTSELEEARASAADMEAALATHTARLDQARGELTAARAELSEKSAGNRALTAELETTKRALEALDEHAETIEAELAIVRRSAESPETRRELEEARAELESSRTELSKAHNDLATARAELERLEAHHVETDRALTRDRTELEQMQDALTSMRQELTAAQETLTAAQSDLTAARRAVDEMHAEVAIAEQARQAVTIDTADLLARAEAQASSLLERANRDAEAIRQEALLWEEGLREEGRREEHRAARPGHGAEESPAELVDRIERLERKVAKQRRRLDRMTETPGVVDAEREAADIRRAARRDREQFRIELAGLLRRLAPLVDDNEDDEDE